MRVGSSLFSHASYANTLTRYSFCHRLSESMSSNSRSIFAVAMSVWQNNGACIQLSDRLPHYSFRPRYVVFVKRRLLPSGNVCFSVNSGGFSAS